MNSKIAPFDLSAFLSQPMNLVVLAIAAVFVFAVMMRLHKETAMVAVTAGVIGFILTT